ncbi:MAG: HpcH/HpaI aldolase/citrate lyase family protein [Rhodobacter sp.]|uniref:HpcH/HpaI aldolase/citrate lyase family protein n=1 Tax=Pararhodobacter sp. TaxID=2127056 RepID=UPI001DF67F61|nr:HpcH/HpaI aldolase/citrate lyase family protein [Pararhodobacter sp.]MCB1346590.1 HpcH/HpaI aldolase/citrate lyase family protein [Paracoccaceae bacterium]MCC0074224.1 HpcH/HpaI aldolase/citrate lyase family protein [Rhodobacter sp.]HPD93642.1 HpcH/HpaI aldolase/citrate lyase family protein [Pararhodobacter sp.]
MQKNGFKAALARGEVQIGCWVGLADGYAAEISGEAGFDWLLIDGEHAPNDLRSMREQLTALGRSRAHPVIRLPVGEVWMVKQALDIGAQTILVPMVESGAQAALLARAMRYPPEGLRGVGAALARASRFSGIADYVNKADAEVCLLVQVENRAGLAALDDILAVEGVDGVFIGPADLSADMGYRGQANAPEVTEAITGAIQRIRAAGKAAGILSTDEAQAKGWIATGANFVAVGIDVLVLANGMRALAARFR